MTDELPQTAERQPVDSTSIQTPSPRGAIPVGATDQPTLDVLVRAVEPLIQSYFANQKEMQRREIAFEEKALAADTKHRRMLVLCGTGILVFVLVLAAYLFYHVRDEAAIKLITLFAGLGGAAFGGYGLAARRGRNTGPEEE